MTRLSYTNQKGHHPDPRGAFCYYHDASTIIKELLDMVEYLGYTKEMGDRIAELRKEYGE